MFDQFLILLTSSNLRIFLIFLTYHFLFLPTILLVLFYFLPSSLSIFASILSLFLLGFHVLLIHGHLLFLNLYLLLISFILTVLVILTNYYHISRFNLFLEALNFHFELLSTHSQCLVAFKVLSESKTDLLSFIMIVFLYLKFCQWCQLLIYIK